MKETYIFRFFYSDGWSEDILIEGDSKIDCELEADDRLEDCEADYWECICGC